MDNKKQTKKISSRQKNLTFDQKVPPHNSEIEELILGTVILDSSVINIYVKHVKSFFYYKEIHQLIHIAIMDLFEHDKPVDMMMVTEQLKRNGTLESIGGAVVIAGLTNRIISFVYSIFNVIYN